MSFQSFTLAQPRPLPVLVLADTSGSMAADGKMEALNLAAAEMIGAFASEEAEICVGVVTFGAGKAALHLPLTPARDVSWTPLAAAGNTPMGAAFETARTVVADRDAIPSRAYTPTLVLLSDGVPTDEWQAPLAALLADERARKAFRMALAIGTDEAGDRVLRTFLGDATAPLFRADDAGRIQRFFRFVTMSVQARSRSVNPNAFVLSDDFEAYDG